MAPKITEVQYEMIAKFFMSLFLLRDPAVCSQNVIHRSDTYHILIHMACFSNVPADIQAVDL